MYKKIAVSYEHVPQFSDRDKAYQRGESALRQFFQYDVELSSFDEVVKNKSTQHIDRNLLVKELQEQYSTLDTSDVVKQNIDSLHETKVYTVITAHQPSLLTGPIYFIYKICSTIALSRKINANYKDFRTVPVFVLGSEDHDFEEIATMHLFGKDFTWNSDQTGPTGRMSLNGLKKVLEQVYEVLGGSEHAVDLRHLLESAYNSSKTYGQFMLHLVNGLFAPFGLIIINMDKIAFKKQLAPYIIRDIKEKDSFYSVRKDQEALDQIGFKDQAYARQINIFWIDGDRHRVINDVENEYLINEQKYNEEELISLINSKPGSVSPNVILRPLYQELIMPNLAYIGGGGEIAYWLERKSLFEKWEIPFPMLIRRDSVMIIDKRSYEWLEGAQMNPLDLFDREEKIIGKYAQQMAPVDIDFSKEKISIHEIFTQVKALAEKIDPTLQKTVVSEEVKAKKSLDYLENKLLKAEKQKNEVGVNKLSKMKHKFFPGNDGLQERYDNFIPYYLKYGSSWFSELIDQLDPLDKSFKILVEE